MLSAASTLLSQRTWTGVLGGLYRFPFSVWVWSGRLGVLIGGVVDTHELLHGVGNLDDRQPSKNTRSVLLDFKGSP